MLYRILFSLLQDGHVNRIAYPLLDPIIVGIKDSFVIVYGLVVVLLYDLYKIEALKFSCHPVEW